MSLKSFLEISDVRARFSREFKSPPLRYKRDIIAPPRTKNYDLVGTAFDYLLQFLVERLNPSAIHNDETWIAEKGAKLLGKRTELRIAADQAIAQAKQNVSEFIRNGLLADELLTSALYLATIDPIYRVGLGHERIGLVSEQDVSDVRDIFTAIELPLFTAEKVCIINPTFGFSSDLVGGADADLIIDDTIIEVKTTKNFKVKRDHFNQLIGYYILHSISGIDGVFCGLDIRKVAIYFARFGYLHTVELTEVVNLTTLADFVIWFKQCAADES